MNATSSRGETPLTFASRGSAAFSTCCSETPVKLHSRGCASCCRRQRDPGAPTPGPRGHGLEGSADHRSDVQPNCSGAAAADALQNAALHGCACGKVFPVTFPPPILRNHRPYPLTIHQLLPQSKPHRSCAAIHKQGNGTGIVIYTIRCHQQQQHECPAATPHARTATATNSVFG